ncbi:ribosomal protein S6 [Metamycoplasma arthritidis]|uniref:Small ribosomal subunit protein bS6 n=1 Tax=Metamycoplasma arthritidis (strain 158L3-1) TaxID=243272 RepID=RS6_META1|nr:30S ribosomal protein S6 [Metamycoplasma arthritidis]B3PN60.1 RecName: Full=Small ribosomal subunit protein bS6; AltName: Full=30S ribosomal protein S6 [Metamycoplasma arthritidis 158L3-1]ACF07462.1 ribosomal protein S6 [Metamycoplasma arthritidis 158L3-1]VEU78983.1 ribosomal protein S6 [Metamycoplasma arthritidis]
MSNYEIMILANPDSTLEQVSELLFSVLKKSDTKIEKLERSELAYPIHKLTRATYYLVTVKSDPQLMAELTRKLNIAKFILRSLIINLDSEKGLKPRKVKRFIPRAKNNDRSANQGDRRPFIRRNQTTDASKTEASTEATASKQSEQTTTKPRTRKVSKEQ